MGGSNGIGARMAGEDECSGKEAKEVRNEHLATVGDVQGYITQEEQACGQQNQTTTKPGFHGSSARRFSSSCPHIYNIARPFFLFLFFLKVILTSLLSTQDICSSSSILYHCYEERILKNKAQTYHRCHYQRQRTQKIQGCSNPQY